MIHNPRNRRRARRGVVLVAVLVVVVLLSLAAYQFGEFMMAEYRASDSYARSAQAKAYADSGVHYLAAVLSNPNTFATTLNNNPYNNPAAFQGVVVDPNAPPRLFGRFTILTLLDPDDPNFGVQGFRPGVTDESGKINLNALMQIDSSGQTLHDMLLKLNLPNLTEDIINSILDWIDPDDTERSNGAEDQYYGGLTPGYHTKNGPLDSLDELLLVKGVMPQLLYGNDRNRNGILDPDEQDASGVLDRGLSAYVTVYGREQNVDSQGNPRIYVNSNDLNTLLSNLSNAVGEDLANYIIAYRQYGGSSTSPNTPGGGGGTGGAPGSGNTGSGNTGNTRSGTGSNTPQGGTSKAPSAPASSGSGSGTGGAGQPAAANQRLNRSSLNLTKGGGNRIRSLFDLVNSQVTIPSSTPGQPAVPYPSPLNDPGTLQQLLPVMFDKLTTSRKPELPARINVNTAPVTILQALPGFSDTDIQNIISLRPNPYSTDPIDPMYLTPAWLITQANISPKTLATVDPYITTRSQVYRAQVVGYFDQGGPTARYEVVIDTNQGYPRVLYQRDISELGKGFNLNAPSP